MPLIIIALGIILLLLLIIRLKCNAFVSLIIVSLVIGLLMGMNPVETIKSVESGIGGMLGSLALILGFGAMLGKLMEDSGAAQRIATTLIDRFGRKNIQWAGLLTGFIVGIALFFDTGFILLIPLVFTIALQAKLPVLYIGMPVSAALITVHGLFPPHPGPTAIADIFNAQVGMILLIGMIVVIPSIIVSGIIYPNFFLKQKEMEVTVPKQLFHAKILPDEQLPGFGVSLLMALLPVVLMGIRSILELTITNSKVLVFFHFVGDPAVALLITLIIAIYTLGLKRGLSIGSIMKSLETSVLSIAMILLINGGGGALKQVIIDSGTGDYIASLMKDVFIPPLLLGFFIAAALRLTLGAATIAGITASGIVLPLTVASNVSPELMVLAIGAGSMTFSHVNDPGFWIFKEYFNLSIGRTIKTWSMMTLISSLVSLGMILLLSLFIN
ncbi:gluconate:H+ symporter [Niallia sp. 01092]|uniref:gluconate:H+ symporter n=1 Tax=unclassified Niallia TaxID=2837522 RepID=UPI003FD412E1